MNSADTRSLFPFDERSLLSDLNIKKARKFAIGVPVRRSNKISIWKLKYSECEMLIYLTQIQDGRIQLPTPDDILHNALALR